MKRKIQSIRASGERFLDANFSTKTDKLDEN